MGVGQGWVGGGTGQGLLCQILFPSPGLGMNVSLLQGDLDPAEVAVWSSCSCAGSDWAQEVWTSVKEAST